MVGNAGRDSPRTHNVFAQNPISAIAVAMLYGLFGGLPTAAYVDLIIRSCPKGLEGTGMMLAVTTALAVASNSGNLLGSWIYSRGGFASAVIITTLATVLIVPMLWWVPEGLTSTREGELSISTMWNGSAESQFQIFGFLTKPK